MKKNMMVVAGCLVLSTVLTFAWKGTMAMFAEVLSGCGFFVCFFSFFFPRSSFFTGNRNPARRTFMDEGTDPFKEQPQTDYSMLMCGTAVIVAGVILSYLI